MSDFAFTPKLHKAYDTGSEKDFSIMREGKPIGELMASDEGEGNVRIHSMGVYGTALGPRHVRELSRQLKEHFPHMQSVSGKRLSGARGGNWESGEGPEVKVKVR